MKINQIINKIESGKFTKVELSHLMTAIATAISEGNHDKKNDK